MALSLGSGCSWPRGTGLLASACLLASSFANASGVLVGLRKQGGETERYRTLWIVASGGAPRLAGTAKGLLVPRSKGFWKVDVVSRVCSDGRFKVDELVAGPRPGAKPSPGRCEKMGEELCSGGQQRPGDLVYEDRIDIRYVGPKYLAREFRWSQSSCVVHPDGGGRYEVASLDRLQQGIRIQSVFGSGIVLQAREEKERAYGHCAEGDGDCTMMRAFEVMAPPADYKDLNPSLSIPEWAITRDAGAWRLLVALTSEESSRYAFPLVVSVRAPSSIVGPTAPLPPKLSLPEGVDAFASPDGDVAVVRAKNRLLAYAIRQATPVEPPTSIETDSEEEIVLVEWASDSHVDRWTRAVQAAEK